MVPSRGQFVTFSNIADLLIFGMLELLVFSEISEAGLGITFITGIISDVFLNIFELLSLGSAIFEIDSDRLCKILGCSFAGSILLVTTVFLRLSRQYRFL